MGKIALGEGACNLVQAKPHFLERYASTLVRVEDLKDSLDRQMDALPQKFAARELTCKEALPEVCYPAAAC